MDPLKTIFLGASGVGKTCLVYYAVDHTFSDLNSPTIGATTATVSVLNGQHETIKFALMDTAGQEKYRSIVPIYFRNVQIAIFVYDITNKDSFNELREFHTLLVKNTKDDIMLVVVGAKKDLESERTVSYDEGNEFAKEIKAKIFIELSSKTGEGVTELLDLLANDSSIATLMREDPLHQFQIGSDIHKKKCSC